MVTLQHYTQTKEVTEELQQPFNWVSLPIQELFNADLRLEATVYATEAEKAKLAILKNKYGVIELSSLIKTNHCPRFKRVFVKNSDFPIYQPSQIKDQCPLPAAFISDRTDTDINALKVKKGQLLMTCSGTVGKVTVVSKALEGLIFSHDLLRINLINPNDLGYLYTYFLSKVGKLIIQSNNYGAVIQHIEPEHLLKLPVPNAPALLKRQLQDLIMQSFDSRDKSNVLLKQAQDKLKNALRLPPVALFDTIKKDENNPHCFQVSINDLNGRFEANYHHPVARAVQRHLVQHAVEVTSLADKKLVRSIVLPGRFKRHYVSAEFGVPFIGGKEILELDPRGEKFLSLKQHGGIIENQLTIDQNMILITCSGTIGKVTLAPMHWKGWAASQHLLRVVPANTDCAGYLYAWLSSEWALPLIKRHTYGAVVFEIDQHQLANVEVPLLEPHIMQEINQLVLDANSLRYRAFQQEQEALEIFDRQILS